MARETRRLKPADTVIYRPTEFVVLHQTRIDWSYLPQAAHGVHPLKPNQPISVSAVGGAGAGGAGGNGNHAHSVQGGGGGGGGGIGGAGHIGTLHSRLTCTACGEELPYNTLTVLSDGGEGVCGAATLRLHAGEYSRAEIEDFVGLDRIRWLNQVRSKLQEKSASASGPDEMVF